MSERLALAVEIAREAGDATLARFRERAFDVELKDDGSHVTVADREAETLLRRRIESRYPHDAVLGEEHGHTPGTSGFRWLLDPIDGTASFVHGVPLYGTLVAVERDPRVSVAGVIYLPALDEMVYASDGEGAWHVVGTKDAPPRPARVSDTGALADSLLCVTSFDYFDRTGRRELFLELCAAFGHTRGWSDCYAHVLVATGRADAVVEPMVSPWDVAPMIVIAREAGGACTDWRGEPIAHSGVAAITNGRIHRQVLELLG